ncbi:MAG: VacJ family lipoprotein [Nitrospira sp.]|nr:VacJ family lipoprotein [Nitrospira sp.]MDD9859821.1 VacJ family lipoprotein [Nitrospira sp.]
MRTHAQDPKNVKAGTGRALTLTLALFALMTGCATTQSATVGESDIDPLEPVNRPIYWANDFIDQTIAAPVATAYVAYTPSPIRAGVSNFFDNVSYPNVILNSFLQGKGDQGIHDVGRFLVNSTFGCLGLFDMATPLGLYAHAEDFGQTLGVWGVDESVYLMLPFIGPNDLRDTPNLGIGVVTNILFYVSNPYVVPVAILGLVDKRARESDAVTFRDRAAVEPYVFTREAYRQHRTFMIHDGDPPVEDLEDPALGDETLTDLDAGEDLTLQIHTDEP